jgi:cell division transport system permease protein
MSSNKRANYTPVIISLTLVVFLLSLLGLVLINANHASEELKRVELVVYLETGRTINEAEALKATLTKMPVIHQIKLVDGDMEFQQNKEEWEKEYGEFLDENPIPHQIELSLKSDVRSKQEVLKVKEEISQMAGVSEVTYPANVVNFIEQSQQKLTWWIIGLTFILFLIAVAVIYNTVKLDLHGHRFEIKTMQLVGARPGFIRKPFLLRAAQKGLVALIIGIGLAVVFLYVWIKAVLPLVIDPSNQEKMQTWIREDLSLYITMSLAIIAFILLVVISSTFVVSNRFLKRDIGELY